MKACCVCVSFSPFAALLSQTFSTKLKYFNSKHWRIFEAPVSMFNLQIRDFNKTGIEMHPKY